ncbi:MAG: class I SAM-dependent methyltransferase [Cyanobacteria bacterium P01_G01_bin.19]
MTEKVAKINFLINSTVEQRRAMFPPVTPLQEKHIANCRLIENRNKMLEYMPENAVCAEIGIWKCDFSEKIIRITQPKKLHLIDVDDAAIEIANQKFAQDISNEKVAVHLGDSFEIINSMPNNYFDWVYIDGDHSYEGVKRDLNATRLKLKSDGLIALNDYIFLGSLELAKYGVIEAANEFCLKHDFEMIYFALQGRMYNDVVLRKL